MNPISGGIDKSDLLLEIEKELIARKIEYQNFYTSGGNDCERLAKQLKAYKPSRIFTLGGDGTIKMTAELIGQASIPIAIFPAGSANGLAVNLNLPVSTADLLKVAFGQKFIDLDTILINGELCLHISDIGLNANLIKNYQEGNIRGKLGYFLHTIPTLIESNFPFSFSIEINDKIIRREAVLVAVANARKYGTGATINPKGRYDDGKLEILVFKKLDLGQILETFKEHGELNSDFVEIFQAVSAVIKSDTAIPFQIDGEYRGEVQKVAAEISSLKIKITVP